MAAEFYQKTSGLFEELKRRELHFLNTQASADYNKRSNGGAQLQDYLRKVSETEKSNEKFHSSIMKNLQSFGEDLSSLQTSLEELSITQHFTKYDNITNASLSYRDSNSNLAPLKSSCSLTVSTQTDFIFCDHCHSPLTSTPSFNPMFKSPSEPREASVFDNDRYNDKDNSHDVGASHSNGPNLRSGAKFQNGLNMENLSRTDKEDKEKDNSTTEINGNQRNLVSNETVPQVSNNQQQTSSIDDTKTRKEAVNVNVVGDKRNVGEETVTRIKTSNVISGEADIAVNDIDKAKQVIANEDEVAQAPVRPPRKHDGSVNKEFDFLEDDRDDTEKRGKESATNARVKEWLKGVDLSPDEISNSQIVQNDRKESQTNVKDAQSTSDDSSSSEDAPVTKPVPVVETEAYKSLLLGINSQVKNSKVASGSDSDDEIEKALKLKAAKTAVSKSAPSKITFLPSDMKKSAIKEQKKTKTDSDDIEQAVRAKSALSKDKSMANIPFDVKDKVLKENDTKQNVRSSKTTAAARPQSKLAKQTRKVLGLGSSSSSEANADVVQKPTKEDNSDEFSFYD